MTNLHKNCSGDVASCEESHKSYFPFKTVFENIGKNTIYNHTLQQTATIRGHLFRFRYVSSLLCRHLKNWFHYRIDRKQGCALRSSERYLEKSLCGTRRRRHIQRRRRQFCANATASVSMTRLYCIWTDRQCTRSSCFFNTSAVAPVGRHSD